MQSSVESNYYTTYQLPERKLEKGRSIRIARNLNLAEAKNLT